MSKWDAPAIALLNLPANARMISSVCVILGAPLSLSVGAQDGIMPPWRETTAPRGTELDDPTCAERLYANGSYDAPGHF